MRFIESILYRDGVYHNLDLHQERVDRTFAHFMPEIQSHQLSKVLPPLTLDGTYKVRLVYDADLEDSDYNLEFSEYYPRKIDSLQIVNSEAFDYSFKFEDRNHIQKLVNQSAADDIIISVDGKITDGSYFNLVFWDGSEWITPNTPILNGVRRQQLLTEKKIKEAPISVSDLGAFKELCLINAMLDLGEYQLSLGQVLKG